jgi:RimJ/RimL family protein N-acetyltransferase
VTTREQAPQSARIEIETQDGLSLKQLVPDDDQAYYDALHHDPDRFKHGEERTLAKYPSVEAVRQSIEDPDELKLRMGVWDGETMVAYASLLFNRPRSAELGYWSGYAGKGYSERAARALVDYGFANYPIYKITAWAAVDNTGSRKVLDKLGFTQATQGNDQVLYELNRPTQPNT